MPLLNKNIRVFNSYKESLKLSLAGVAQWIEHWPVNQRVTDLIPSQGTCLGCQQSL